MKPNYYLIRLIQILLLFPLPLLAQDKSDVDTDDIAAIKNTLNTLESFVDLRNNLQQDIRALSKQLGAAQSVSEKKDLQQQLDKLKVELRATSRNFEDIVAGGSLSSLREEDEEAFNFQKEVFTLLEPIF